MSFSSIYSPTWKLRQLEKCVPQGPKLLFEPIKNICPVNFSYCICLHQDTTYSGVQTTKEQIGLQLVIMSQALFGVRLWFYREGSEHLLEGRVGFKPLMLKSYHVNLLRCNIIPCREMEHWRVLS